MWTHRGGRLGSAQSSPKRDGGAAAAPPRSPRVAVAVDRDKHSHYALNWTLDNLVARGQTVLLVHVRHPTSRSSPRSAEEGQEGGARAREVFVTFRNFCAMKYARCEEVLLEHDDVATAVIEFVSRSAVEKLVVGLPSAASSFVKRFMGADRDIPTAICRGAPDFCAVYVVGKRKVSARKEAVRPPPPPAAAAMSPLHHKHRHLLDSPDLFRHPPRASPARAFVGMQSPEPRIWLHSPSRLSSDDRFFPSRLSGCHLDIDYPPSRLSMASDGYDLIPPTPSRSSRGPSLTGFDFAAASPESGRSSLSSQWSAWSSHAAGSPQRSIHSPCPLPEEVEEEMRRLRQELKQTMDMYSSACQEAVRAKQMARELRRWRKEEKRRMERARAAGAEALAVAEQEKAKALAAAAAEEEAKRKAELEVRRRKAAVEDAEERNKALTQLMKTDTMYRRYTIEEIEVATDFFAERLKIGEGGYGPVFRGTLDHTPVAIKILRPDAAQGRSQFQQEVLLLSCIRHPNMVLLLGACPEYGCLVYEYMEKGSLEDRLMQRQGTPPLTWQLRFKIAAEIATGLLFLHQARPQPVVHRDLKPGNILLDAHFVSKIADVGLARLVPSAAADRVTSTAGTVCYIDPEYQRTGVLCTKSDIYSLGIILLQLLTGLPPTALSNRVERTIEEGVFSRVLDPAVPDWPVHEALALARLALRCAELRRKDRPDLNSVILPELNSLREMADQSLVSSPVLPDDVDDAQTTLSHDNMSDHPVRSSCESRASGPPDE
ncbi:U-box domain-containing protein 52-like [Wolffia australiana]